MECKMAEQKETQQPPKTKPPRPQPEPCTEAEKGLPPVDLSPLMPAVKPPKK